MTMKTRFLIACALLSAPAVAADDRFGPDDIARLADVAGPVISPDGRLLAYSVESTNKEEDEQTSDLWRVAWDGGARTQLTNTPESNEWLPQWSNDGRSLAFLADRGGDEAKTQVWVMPADGGEARHVTKLPEGVEDFVWSPDGKRLAVISWDPELPAGTPRPKNPPPIVTDRYQFKEDVTGYLTARRKHLYVIDVASGTATLLTPGAHDEQLPSWSPDGKTIAYVTKRGADPDRHLNFDI
jgi:Tol biopolymer transport system component